MIITTPLLSVVIATYNRAESLRRAIQSVLDEPGDFFEVLVGDDGSPDHTPDVIQTFHDSRLRHYRNATNLGMRDHYLKIVREARGEYIFILTDDDWLLPGALQRVAEIIRTYPEVGYILSHLPTVDERNHRVVGMHRTYPDSRLLPPTVEAMAGTVGSAWVLSRQVLKRDLIDWATWEAHKSNIYFPIIVAGRQMLRAPTYYLAEPLVMHTWFNKVFWHQFGKNQLEIEFNLVADHCRCMRIILHDYEKSAQVQKIIQKWERDSLKGYLFAEQMGFYDALRGWGIRPALAKLSQGFNLDGYGRFLLVLFFLVLPFRLVWMGLKLVVRRIAPGLFYALKALKDGTVR